MALTPGHDADRIRASVQRRGIAGIYHYTAITNLPSILREGGLLSRAEMDRRGIQYVRHGWGRPGKEKELEDYVCCSFVPHWGMLRRETEPQAVLKLKPDLIWRDGTLFCPGNSASNLYDLNSLRNLSTMEAFDAMFPNLHTGFPEPYQCEVMVRGYIPLDYLQSVHFRTTDDHTYGTTLMRDTLKEPAVRERLMTALPIRAGVSPGLYPPQ